VVVAVPVLLLLQGENWHGNHHAQPWCARLGLTRGQVDAGWWVIVTLEKLGLARDVRRPRHGETAPRMQAVALETR